MGMKIAMVMWVTKDLKVDMAAYKDLIKYTQELSPMTADMVKEMAKIDGIPVLTETNTDAMGTTMKNREEVVSAEEKAAPAGTYDVPAGYKVEAFDLMKLMMKGVGT